MLAAGCPISRKGKKINFGPFPSDEPHQNWIVNLHERLLSSQNADDGNKLH